MTETLFGDIQSRIAEKIDWLNGQVDEDYGQLEMLYREDADSETYPLTFPAGAYRCVHMYMDNLGRGRSKHSERYMQSGRETGNRLL